MIFTASLSAAAALPPIPPAAPLSRHVWVASLCSCGALLQQAHTCAACKAERLPAPLH